MMRRRSAIYTLFICIFLVGCNRGCTTVSTLDSDSKEVTRRGEKIILKARVLDHRNSKRKGNNIFNRTISHSYSLSFSVNVFGNEFGEFFSEGVASPDNVDLVAALKRVDVDLSKDKKHLGVGVDGLVVGVIHIYKNEPIVINGDTSHMPVGMKWSDLDLESYDDPEIILLGEIRDNCDYFMFNKEIAMDMLDGYNPWDTIQRMILSNWPECSFAKDYLNKNRTKKFLKNRVWKRYAVNRGMEVIHNNRLASWEIEEMYEYLLSLNSPKLTRSIDSSYVNDWGSKGSGTSTSALIKRMKSKKRPMERSLRLGAIIDARSNFEKFMRSGQSFYKKEASSCMAVLLADGDTLIAEDFLKDALVSNQQKYGIFDLIEVVFDNFEEYTSAQQRFIIKHTPSLFANCEDYARSILFRDAEEYIPCSQLKKWLSKYSNDLSTNKLPASCGGSKRR